MNSSVSLYSPLAEPIELFLVHHRGLGKQFDSEEHALRLLDRYLVEQLPSSPTIDQITPALLERFLLSRPRTTNRSYNHLHNVLARLFRWMVAQHIIVESPLRTQKRQSTQRQLPYLFDQSGIQQLLCTTAQLPDVFPAIHRGITYRMIFALMYAVGLRVSEAAHLCHRDLDLEHDCLHIRETKFSKSRLVPFGPRLGQTLRQYLKECEMGTASPDDPLFSISTDRRQPIKSKSISRVFRITTGQLGLEVPAGVAPPRLHCLRHSFAVSTLLRWYKEGINPNDRLMHLCVFMGHVNPASTAVYLTITAELLDLANDRFCAYADPVLRGIVR